MLPGIRLASAASDASAGHGFLLSSAQFEEGHVPLRHSFLFDMRPSFNDIGWNFQG